MSSEFFTISAKALEEAEQSSQFSLVVPDNARPDRAGTGHRWSECVDIESVDAVMEPEKQRMYFEVALTINGETLHPGNIGKQVSRRFYVMAEAAPATDGQRTMSRNSLARVQELVKACGHEVPKPMTSEWISEMFGFDSPLKGQKAWVEIYQHTRKNEPGRLDIDFSKFIPYTA